MLRILILFIFILVSIATPTGQFSTPPGQRILAKTGLSEFIIIEYNAFENKIRLSSKVDFADVKITFEDISDQTVTVKELRQWVKAQYKPGPIK